MKMASTHSNPFKGLNYYEEEDSNIFFGRENESEALTELVKLNRLTLVFGKSGIGKTSLLNAGLFPLLRKINFLPIRIQFNHLVDRMSSDGTSLLNQIKQAITQELNKHDILLMKKGEDVTADAISNEESLWEYFRRVDFKASKPNENDLSNGVTPVLILDQFEEFFRLKKHDPQRQFLMDELFWLVEDQVPPHIEERILSKRESYPYLREHPVFRVLLSFREEYLPHLNEFKKRIPSLHRVLFQITHLNGLQAREVMEKTGAFSDESIKKDILKQFYPDDIDQENICEEKLEIETALFSLLCDQVYEKGVGVLTNQARDEILTEFYQQTLCKLPNCEQLTEWIENHLLTEDGARTPRVLERDFSMRQGIEAAINEKLLRKMYIGEKEHVEIIHDVLAPIIQQQKVQRLEEQKRRSEEQKRLDTEKDLAMKRELRQKRRWMTIISICAIIAVAFAIFAFLQMKVAKKNEHEAIAQRIRADKEKKIADEQAQKLNEQKNVAQENEKIAKENEQKATAEKVKLKRLSNEYDALNKEGRKSNALGETEKALKAFGDALSKARAAGNTTYVADTLNNIGMVYSSLGEKEKAQSYYEQALSLRRAIGDRGGEATTLINIGSVYSSLGEQKKALSHYEQALPIVRAVGDLSGQATTLNNIGSLYDSLGEKKKALSNYEHALPTFVSIGDRRGEATTLNNIGSVYDSLNEKEKALNFYEQALPTFIAVGDHTGEASVLKNLMSLFNSLNNKPVAIFFGKQTVNCYQHLRKNITTLSQKTQHTYLKSVQDTYHYLIDILFQQNRIGEALVVTDMLKDENYFSFIRRDHPISKSTPHFQKIDYTQFEQEWLKKYNETLKNITFVSKQYQELVLVASKNKNDQNFLHQLEVQLSESRRSFEKYLHQLKNTDMYYPKINFNETEIRSVSEKIQAIQSTLRYLDEAEGGKSITLHYFLSVDKINIILTTPFTQVLIPITCDQKIMNNLIMTYHQSIGNGGYVRGVKILTQSMEEIAGPTSKKIYDFIFMPVERDLKNYGATNIMVYLDGVLRDIPFATLWDGKSFLVQRFRLSNITTSSLLNIKDEPSPNFKILGMGTPEGGLIFAPSPGIADEIQAIVNDKSSGYHGMIEGKVLVNNTFTKNNMIAQLKSGQYPLVHIASHFQFNPSSENESFMLLGDGNKMTLSEIRRENNLFYNVDMLVLSSCQTATGSGNGEEIDGFAELALISGAKCVVGSLWNVGDNSTKELMVAFYQNLTEKRFTSKIEALRQAQLEVSGLDDLLPATPIKHNKTKYASPYYWGPFIMMGNWR